MGGSEQAPPYRNACSIAPAQQVRLEEAVPGFKASIVGRQREGESREAEAGYGQVERGRMGMGRGEQEGKREASMKGD